LYILYIYLSFEVSKETNNNMKLGTGKTKVGTKLGFNVMSNPFKLTILTKEKAIKLIKEAGFRFKTIKNICIQPIGDTEKVYEFIDSLQEERIHTTNNGITI